MSLRLRLLCSSVLVGPVLVWASAASACATSGYSYAGVDAPTRAYGIAATITPLSALKVSSGHVAGWVGVGGPRLGPQGKDEWLQVGFSGFPDMTGSDLYYEVTLPDSHPTYHQVATGWRVGKSARVAVLEIRGRTGFWRVWVNGSPVSEPIRLPSSHGRWRPVASAESLDDGADAVCNGFLYRFHGISLARAPGGRWQPLLGGYPVSDTTSRIEQQRAASFLAARGDDAVAPIASFSP